MHYRLPRLLGLFIGLCSSVVFAQVQAVKPISPDQNNLVPQNTVPQQANESPTPLIAGQSTTVPELLIGDGDLLQVTVYGAPDFDKQVRVSSDGSIYLPLIGAVQVMGLPVHDAEELVQKRLAEGKFFTDPQVSILIKEFASQGISVLGEVQKPGIYPLLGTRTLFDALSAAGGTTPKAGPTVTVTHRNRPSDPVTIKLNYDAKGSPESNIALLPGDTVVVSKAGIVYVVGDVRLPAGFVMENPELTVLQALAMAQGANPTASLDGSKIIRRAPGASPVEIPIKLKQIMAAKTADVRLQPDDILFIPQSAGKSAMRRGFEATIQMATGMAIYRTRP